MQHAGHTALLLIHEPVIQSRKLCGLVVHRGGPGGGGNEGNLGRPNPTDLSKVGFQPR